MRPGPFDGQIQYGFWAVTKFTKIEQEILLYPFTSLLAEFGGALGLFLGFSIMTIWDGVEGILGHWLEKTHD